jgi:formate dehydrogenase maturation protein FdhE
LPAPCVALLVRCLDNCLVTESHWQGRIERAQALASQYQFAAEILAFYIHVARFQENLHQELSQVLQSPASLPVSMDRELGQAELAELTPRFDSFLSLGATHGPEQMASLCRELSARGPKFWVGLLNMSWTAHTASDAQGLLSLAFLQPYAQLIRSRSSSRSSPLSRSSARPNQHTHALCPFCRRKPAVGVLRQQGDGGARSLICSFCSAEWEFRRLVCPGCGEEDDKKLPLFTTDDFTNIRVECCDSCKTYLKTVDLTKDGRAEPIVDELASAPLDLWARDRGYAKLQNNLLGM